MGDLESPLEKAREVMTEEQAKDVQDKFLKGEFNLVDLYQQMQSMKKMGSFGKIMEMIPGMSSLKSAERDVGSAGRKIREMALRYEQHDQKRTGRPGNHQRRKNRPDCGWFRT